jgi:hypothetical protein
MEMHKIEWMPLAPSGRQWWVYAYAATDDGKEIIDSYVKTERLVGQFESMEAALAKYPDAKLSTKSIKDLENQQEQKTI